MMDPFSVARDLLHQVGQDSTPRRGSLVFGLGLAFGFPFPKPSARALDYKSCFGRAACDGQGLRRGEDQPDQLKR